MPKILVAQIITQVLPIPRILLELGMASVKADYTIGKVEAVADLGFGRRANEFSYNESGGLTAIKQAYISYSPSLKSNLLWKMGNSCGI